MARATDAKSAIAYGYTFSLRTRSGSIGSRKKASVPLLRLRKTAASWVGRSCYVYGKLCSEPAIRSQKGRGYRCSKCECIVHAAFNERLSYGGLASRPPVEVKEYVTVSWNQDVGLQRNGYTRVSTKAMCGWSSASSAIGRQKFDWKSQICRFTAFLVSISGLGAKAITDKFEAHRINCRGKESAFAVPTTACAPTGN
jgi:hypothetical protein